MRPRRKRAAALNRIAGSGVARQRDRSGSGTPSHGFRKPLAVLLVEEAVRGDDHQVFIASWKRTDVVSAPTPGLVGKETAAGARRADTRRGLPRRRMLVLSPSNVTLYTHAGSQWESQRAVPLESKAWPKDVPDACD